MIASELKKALIGQGFEIYRTLADRVVLAERVRDNLIMDSGVAALLGAPGVRFTVRAQASDFAGESEQLLFQRARALGEPAIAHGYVELESNVVPVPDPSDRARTLDTWYEVTFQKQVEGVDQLFPELRFALGLEKTVSKTSGG